MAGAHVYRTTKTTKLQGKLRQKTKAYDGHKGYFYFFGEKFHITVFDGFINELPCSFCIPSQPQRYSSYTRRGKR